ncbi:hypothetical protein CAPTEDRAFT_113705, partial [Capitella teleta]
KEAEYFHRHITAQRIAAISNATKIIVILRNPIKRLLSDYLFMRRYAFAPNALEKTKDFSELVLEVNSSKVNASWGGVARSLYAKHFGKWLLNFPRKQILLVDGDRFQMENPAEILHGIESFLGIDHYLQKDHFFLNTTKGFYCSRIRGCLKEGKGHHPIDLTPRLMEILRTFFEPFNQMFYQMSGVDFGW